MDKGKLSSFGRISACFGAHECSPFVPLFITDDDDDDDDDENEVQCIVDTHMIDNHIRLLKAFFLMFFAS